MRKFEPDTVLLLHIEKFPTSLNDVDREGKTALMWAVEKGRECVLHKAFENGVRIEYVDNDGWSAVMYAARRGNVEIVNFLLGLGASLNHASTEDGFTALHLAAGNELIDVCTALIKAGANPDAIDFDGKVPFDYIRVPKNAAKWKECLEETYKNGRTYDQIHKQRVEMGTEKSVSFAIEKRYSSKSLTVPCE